MPRRCTATASCPASPNCRTAGMRCSSARGPIVRSRLPSSLRAGTGAVRRRARRRPRAAADRQPARVPHRMARAAAHWRHRRARLLGPCAGQGTRVHGRLLAFARRGLGRCRWLRAHRRPHERHAQSRRLHARFGRGRQRADGPAWSRPRSLASPARCWASACTPSSTPTGTEPVDDALRRHGAERRAGYQVPESITWSARTLPRSANGKLLKGALRGPVAVVVIEQDDANELSARRSSGVACRNFPPCSPPTFRRPRVHRSAH